MQETYTDRDVSNLRRVLAEERGAATRVVRCWERLGACYDEFEPDGHKYCGEWADALDTAIIELRRALGFAPTWREGQSS